MGLIPNWLCNRKKIKNLEKQTASYIATNAKLRKEIRKLTIDWSKLVDTEHKLQKEIKKQAEAHEQSEQRHRAEIKSLTLECERVNIGMRMLKEKAEG